jgi:protein-S-isoprenylcysteine O-methyltransferase Ste14
MIKIILLSVFAGVVVLLLLMASKRLRAGFSRIVQNPLVRGLLFRGIWRLIRLLIFRR